MLVYLRDGLSDSCTCCHTEKGVADHASVSQGRICWESCTCCHTERGVASQTCYLSELQCADAGPTSPSANPIHPDRIAAGVSIFRVLVGLELDLEMDGESGN